MDYAQLAITLTSVCPTGVSIVAINLKRNKQARRLMEFVSNTRFDNNSKRRRQALILRKTQLLRLCERQILLEVTLILTFFYPSNLSHFSW